MSNALTRLESDHKTRLLQTKAKTIESIFEHAAAVLAFYEDCKKQREWGENTFANRIGEWCNYSHQTAGNWLMIARAQNKFTCLTGELPPSMFSLALLAPLPQEDIEECLAPSKSIPKRFWRHEVIRFQTSCPSALQALLQSEPQYLIDPLPCQPHGGTNNFKRATIRVERDY